MAEKELRKLNRRELLQMLLVQCEETERLQQEWDEIKEQFESMSESYERLKVKLNVKDERLNEKDTRIAELGSEIGRLKAELEELKKSGSAGTAAEAADRIGEIFREAQKAAEEYLAGIRKDRNPTAEKPLPFETGKIASLRKKQEGSRQGQVVPMASGQTKAAGNVKLAEAVQTGESGETEFASLDMAAGGIYG